MSQVTKSDLTTSCWNTLHHKHISLWDLKYHKQNIRHVASDKIWPDHKLLIQAVGGLQTSCWGIADKLLGDCRQDVGGLQASCLRQAVLHGGGGGQCYMHYARSLAFAAKSVSKTHRTPRYMCPARHSLPDCIVGATHVHPMLGGRRIS